MADGPPYIISDWQSAAAGKRKTLLDSIPQSYILPGPLALKAATTGLLPGDVSILACGILSPLDIEITSIEEAPVLLERIARKQYSAVQVTEAFCKRAAIAQQCTGCLSELMFEKAVARAREVDDYLSLHGKLVGILHGLPVSLKDCFDVEGVNTNAGLVSWLPYIAPKNSSVVKGLLSAGAVLFAKTSSSQSLLMVESINNIFGTVKNPYNLALTVGGSSGGEACLVAAKGSILGSGTDGGGSLRFPSAHCGLWALKPSKFRISGSGVSSPRSGSESVNQASGPLARSVAGLELWVEAHLLSEPWNTEPDCIPMPWKSAEAQRADTPLTIGVIWDDGVVQPTPPVKRALQITVEVLSQAGHTIKHLPSSRIFPLHRQSYACTMLSNVQDGGRCAMAHIAASNEPVVPRTATGSDASALTAAEVFENHLLRSRLAAAYNELWIEYGLDTILVPSVAHPANPHGKYIGNSYATVYNMLDYVTGCVPVTIVDEQLDVAGREWYDGEIYGRIEEVRFPYDLGDKEMKELYTSPKVFKDSPVGVQIVCRRLQEEKCIGILKELEALLKGETEIRD
ncbi:hypothetical protein B7463_g11272, partial [Scytalidium lignicola]